MFEGVSHDKKEEDLTEKARWFQSLTLPERMEMLCAFTDLFLENNPSVAEKNDAQPIARRIRVVSKPQS